MKITIKTNALKSKLNDIYQPCFTNYDNYYEIYYGGAGSGKSHFIARKLVMKALKSKRNILIIRKVATSLTDSVYKLIVSILDKWSIKEHCHITKSPLFIKLPNGSTFLFKGLDDEEKIKSIEDISDIWIEEASELTKNDFDQLCLRMRGSGKEQQIFLSFNPISAEHWIHDNFFKRIDEKAFILKTTFLHNKFLPESYINKIRELEYTNPRYYKIYGLGEFGTAEGLIFTNWKVKDSLDDIVKNFDYKRIGIDWGWNDPTAIIHVAVRENDLYIYQEYYKTEKTKEEIMQENYYLKKENLIAYADSAEPATIKSFQNAGFNVRQVAKPPGSVADGLSAMRNFDNIYIDSRCVNTIKEFANYTNKFDKRTGKYIDEPIDTFNHSIDAIRYGLFDYINNMMTRNKDFGALKRLRIPKRR
jgi:phage terminase large subunit